jgi:probable F420-dependent oxidoreductase
MEYGIVLPKHINPDELIKFTAAAEELGFHSLWAADHIVLPIEETDLYPYTDDGRFTANSQDPQLDAFTLLSFIASQTNQINLGTSVAIVPYRNPILQAKMFASLDVLTKGRVICGAGVGWWKEEFAALDAPFEKRGLATDEYLQIFKLLWTSDVTEFHGETYEFSNIAFFPKPVQKPNGIPIWIGGHTKRAVRRAVKYGDTWHPTRLRPDQIENMLPFIDQQCEKHDRKRDEITISLKRTLHFTDIGIETNSRIRSKAALIDSTHTVVEDIKHCEDLGIKNLTFDFQTNKTEECIKIMEHLMDTEHRIN